MQDHEEAPAPQTTDSDAHPGIRRRVALGGLIAVVAALGVTGTVLRLGAKNTASPSRSAGASVSLPNGLRGEAMAYDPLTHTDILFGGTVGEKTPNADTYSWNGSGWTLLHPAHSPSARENAQLAFDPATGTLVLAGGTSIHTTTEELCATDQPILTPSVPGTAGGSRSGGSGSSVGGSGGGGSAGSGLTGVSAGGAGTAVSVPCVYAPGVVQPGGPAIGVGGGGSAGSANATRPLGAAGVAASASTTQSTTVTRRRITVEQTTSDTDMWTWNGSDWTRNSATVGVGDELVTDTAAQALLDVSSDESVAVPIAVPDCAPSAPCPLDSGSMTVRQLVNGSWHTLAASSVSEPILAAATDPTTGDAVVFVGYQESEGCGIASPGAVNTSTAARPPSTSSSSSSTGATTGSAIAMPCCPAVPVTSTARTSGCSASSGSLAVLIWNGHSLVRHSLSGAAPDLASADTAHGDIVLSVDGSTDVWTLAGGERAISGAAAPGLGDGSAMAAGPDGSALLVTTTGGVLEPAAVSNSDATTVRSLAGGASAAATRTYRWTGTAWAPAVDGASLSPTATATASPSASAVPASAPPTAVSTPSGAPSSTPTATVSASASPLPSSPATGSACPVVSGGSALPCPTVPAA